MMWYKNNPDDKIWWKDTSEKCIGEFVFSFDGKTFFNMFRDYPHALTQAGYDFNAVQNRVNALL